ncbi:MAG: hypothetical protein IPH23_08595 [Gammaproteobacteria bacterium]|nr:hypothetical protein [Gammaproteobacteria bacterium]
MEDFLFSSTGFVFSCSFVASHGKISFDKTPIAIAGVSKHSTGAANILSPIGNEAKPLFIFNSEQNIPFHESLIVGKSVQIVLYECYLQSWHLHHGGLGLSLENQLQVATKIARLTYLDTVRDECQRIAEINGVCFLDRTSWVRKFQPLLSIVKREWWNFEVNPEKLDIVNVYEATIASAYIHKFIRQSGFRYILLGSNFIGQVIYELGEQ